MKHFNQAVVCLQAMFPPVVEKISLPTVRDEGLPPT